MLAMPIRDVSRLLTSYQRSRTDDIPADEYTDEAAGNYYPQSSGASKPNPRRCR